MRVTALASSLGSLGLVTILAACAAPPAADEAPAHQSQRIIGGQYDTTHEAVVAVLQDQGLCTGTIVKTEPSTGVLWVLTAAHCVTSPPKYVVQGPDFQSPTALLYEVLDYAPHPSYTGAVDSNYDFAMVRAAGADASTPTLPYLKTSNDSVTSGKQILALGYGKVQPTDPEPPQSQRKSIALAVSQTSTTKLSFNFQSGGTCQGDSGGPDLYTIGGAEYVAGVHSYGVGGCTGTSVSGRISAATSWADGELAKAPKASACDVCTKTQFSGKNTCAQYQSACAANRDCTNYVSCVNKCSDAACRTACQGQYPLGIGPANAVSTCACSVGGCHPACGASCFGTPACGYTISGAECRTCVEASCCTELAAAAKDGRGYDCIKNNGADPACAKNAAYQKLVTCQSSKCAVCKGSLGDGGGGDPAPADPGSSGDPAASSSSSSGGGAKSDDGGGCQASPGRATSTGLFGLAPFAVALGVLAARRRRR